MLLDTTTALSVSPGRVTPAPLAFHMVMPDAPAPGTAHAAKAPIAPGTPAWSVTARITEVVASLLAAMASGPWCALARATLARPSAGPAGAVLPRQGAGANEEYPG